MSPLEDLTKNERIKMIKEMINLMVCVKKNIPEVKCVQGLCLWRNTSAEVNEEIFKGNWRGNPERMTNEIAAGFSFFFC